MQFKPPQIIFIALLLKSVIHACHCSELHQRLSFVSHLFLSFSRLLLAAPTHISLALRLVNQPSEGDRSCRFPTSQWGASIHPKERHIVVSHNDIMTTWKLINSFIQAKLLLFFSKRYCPPKLLSVCLFSLPLSLLSVTNSSSCTSPLRCSCSYP